MAEIFEHRAPNWNAHIMGISSGNEPFIKFEDDDSEEKAIQGSLQALAMAGMLERTEYDQDAFNRFCDHVREHFNIPWTGISPRMRRMIYAINALHQPKGLVCAGIFCGYTFICNAGASIGPGSCYDANSLVGLEILPVEAERAKKNIAKFSPFQRDMIICSDATEWISTSCNIAIDLLYIDAKAVDFDPRSPNSKPQDKRSEYLKIVEAALPKLRSGSLILAHNSVNAVKEIADYLAFVRGKSFRASMNLIVDDAGLEVSLY